MKIINNNQAFSLIEVMIAVTVVVVGMLAVMSLIVQNITVASMNKNNLIASMLAQEGLELTRSIRDANWLDGSAWDTAITGTYAIDFGGISSGVSDITDVGAKLYIKDNLYQHDATGGVTPFRRLLSVVVDGSGDFLTASSTVRWTKNGVDHDYVAETILYDWR